MRTLLFGVVCAAAFAAQAAPSEASCIATLKWHGHQFTGNGEVEGVSPGAALGEKARIPPCNDVIVNGKPLQQERTRHVVAHRVEGVPPQLAVLVGDDLYVNPAAFPTLASHPLHDVLDREREPLRDPKPCTITGTAVPEAFGFHLRYGRKRTAWVTTTPDADVRIQRFGTGFIRRGTRITVHGTCERNTHYVRLVADRIARAA